MIRLINPVSADVVAAASPAGKKWIQVARQADPVHYVVCNGDEGDPGAFMDGSVMEGDPYKLIEGMMLAALRSRSRRWLYLCTCGVSSFCTRLNGYRSSGRSGTVR